jgi:nucleotide-binding universal stress UspA family protein
MFQKILIPLDGSDVATAILPLLRQILRRTDSEILLLQAVPFPFYPVVSVNVPLSDIEASARAYVRGLQSRWESEGARVRTIVQQGSAAEVILDVAARENASLIALSTHGRTAWPGGCSGAWRRRSSGPVRCRFSSFDRSRGRNPGR